MAYATVTLAGTYQTPDGTPHKGHVEIIPSERVIKDTTGNVILTGRVKVDLDAQGAFTVALPATDDPTLNPTGFGYTIAAKLHSSHPPAVSFSLPASLGATTVEDLTPVDPATFAPTTTYAEKSELDAVAATIPSTAADVNALPDTTQIPSTAADVGALPDTTTPTDIGAEPAGLAQATQDTLANTYARKGPRLDVTKGRGAVVFTWDDTWASHATVANMANTRDQRHTFCIETGQIDVAGRLTTQQIADIYAAGHELAAHSVTHADLDSLTPTAAAAEMDDSKAALEAIIGAGNVPTFAYPNGMNGRNDTTDQLAWTRFDRVLSTGLINNGGVGNTSPYIIADRNRGGLFVTGRYNWTTTTHAYVLDLIRLAARFPVIVVIYGHDLDGSGAPSTANVTEALDLVQSLRVPTLTAAEAFPSPQLLADPSFEDPNLAAWLITNQTGGNVAESAVVTPATGVSGTRALRMNATTGNVQAAQMVPVTPGVGYEISALAKIAAGSTGTAYLRVREFDYKGGLLSSQQSANITATDWTRVSYTRTQNANAKAAYALAEFIANAGAGPVEAWFDHAQFASSLTVGTFA